MLLGRGVGEVYRLLLIHLENHILSIWLGHFGRDIETCLGEFQTANVQVTQTYISRIGRPTAFKPCETQIHICEGMDSDISYSKSVCVCTKSDEKQGLSFEDKRFLKIMDSQCYMENGKWVAPLPFRSHRH